MKKIRRIVKKNPIILSQKKKEYNIGLFNLSAERLYHYKIYK